MKKLIQQPFLQLMIIVVLAGVLRLWNLGIVPPSPNWDEVALGYNAYSILTTGKDEYGTPFPLSLRSYDDYKPPLYMYLTVPSVWVFGLSVWSVRLPAVLMGILAVMGTYWLVKELLLYSGGLQKNTAIPLLSSLLLAISPWHLQFSRMAFEAGVGVTLIIWAVTFFLLGLRKGKYLKVSAILFGLSLYAYHSLRIFAPLLVILLGISFFPLLNKSRKSIFIAVICGIVTIAPLIPVFTDASTLTRLRGTSALADQTRLLERSVIKLERDKQTGNALGLLFDNRRVVFMQTLLSGYLSHYSLVWLFLSGDNARHHAPGMGLLYLLELPFLFIGLYNLVKYGKKMAWIIIGWMLIAPIAASPTTELPHAIRTLVFLPTFQIVIAIGIWTFGQYLFRLRPFLAKSILAICIIIALSNFSYYIVMYHVHQNREFSRFWQYGYKQAVEYAQNHYEEYEKIVVSTKLEQPHMFFLFYLAYDPHTYLQEGGTSSGGFAEVKNKFGKYEFRPINWNEETRDGTILYIASPTELPNANLKKISYLNGEDAIFISR